MYYCYYSPIPNNIKQQQIKVVVVDAEGVDLLTAGTHGLRLDNAAPAPSCSAGKATLTLPSTSTCDRTMAMGGVCHNAHLHPAQPNHNQPGKIYLTPTTLLCHVVLMCLG
jgi:hypothetical protein